VVLATHEITPITNLVRRTVVVDHGLLAYDGPPTAAVLRRFAGTDPDPHAHAADSYAGDSSGVGSLG
jgi:hypothetical protein